MKKNWGLTVDSYDSASYLAGWGMANPLSVGPPTVPGIPTTTIDFCSKFNVIIGTIKDALKEGTGSGLDYNDLGTCSPCGTKTMEIRHGGGESPRRLP